MLLTCPICGNSADVPDDRAGRTVRCRGCESAITVPSSEGFALADEPAFADDPLAFDSQPATGWSGYRPGVGPSKLAAGLLAIFLGDLGAHEFYIGRAGFGVTILMLSVLGVSMLFCLPPAGLLTLACIRLYVVIQGLVFLSSDDRAFFLAYGHRRRR